MDNDDSFELNGQRYAPVVSSPKSRRIPSKLNGIIAMDSAMYMPYMNDFGGNNYERKLPEGTDIVKEYGLIQVKQSKLSKWERDMVTFIFEKNYYKICPTPKK